MIRRLFMRNAPMGAVAAGVIARDVAAKEANWVKPPHPPVPDPSSWRNHPGSASAIVADPLYAIKQAKRIELNKSMNALDRAQHSLRYRRSYVENLNLNIESLRSVSRQHKATMQETFLMSLEEEKKSLLDTLLIKLGFTSQEDAQYYSDQPAKAGRGY